LEHDIELLLQIWKELRTHILAGDRTEAAEDFIHTILEHGVDANEVMEFALDDDLKAILRDHADEEHFDDAEYDIAEEDDENVGWG
jgi:hypothetical protein